MNYSHATWGSPSVERASALFVGGERPAFERLRSATYAEDDSGTYFEIPPGEERQFTIRGSERSLPKSGRVTVTFERVVAPSVGQEWGYRFDVQLDQSHTFETEPELESEVVPALGEGDTTPQC
jgi:hypothetical protein